MRLMRGTDGIFAKRRRGKSGSVGTEDAEGHPLRKRDLKMGLVQAVWTRRGFTRRGKKWEQPRKGMMNPENGRGRIVARFTFRKLIFEGYGLGIEGLRGAEFMQLWGVTGTT